MKKEVLFATQQKILNAAKENKLKNKTLLEIGDMIGVPSPQIVKHHINRLVLKNLIAYNKSTKTVSIPKIHKKPTKNIISIPIYGGVNAGPAEFFIDDQVSGHLMISKSLLPNINIRKLFALKVVGNSMNKEKLNGKSIEEGNYIIAEKTNIANNNDVVISLIDNETINIKKIDTTNLNDGNGYITLKSNSTAHEDYPPIIVKKDTEYSVIGKVVFNVSI